MSAAFVQGKGAAVNVSANGATNTVTIDAAPTAGNTIYAIIAGPIGPSVLVVDPYWTLIGTLDTSQYTNSQGSTGYRGMYGHLVGTGETAVLPLFQNNAVVPTGGWIVLAEYSGLGPAPLASNPTWSDMASGSATNYPLPSQTPVAGPEAVIIAGWEIIPNYNPSFPAGFTQRATFDQGGSRQRFSIGDKIISSPDGVTSHNGNATGAGAETAWHTFSMSVTSPGGGVGSRSFVI